MRTLPFVEVPGLGILKDGLISLDCVAISPNGKFVAAGGDDYVVQIWDFETGEPLKSLSMAAEFKHNFISVLFSPDNQKILASSGVETCMWDWPARGYELPYPVHNFRQVAMSANGRVVVGLNSHGVQVGNWENPGKSYHIWGANYPKDFFDQEVRTGVREARFASCVGVGQDGKLFVTGYNDGSITLRRSDTYEEVWTFQAHPPSISPYDRSGVSDIALTPDNQTLISSGKERTVKFWDVSTRELRHQLPQHPYHIIHMALSPDGKTLVTSETQTSTPKDDMGFIHVWGAPT